MMRSTDVRVGQTVRDRRDDEVYIVLDKHPERAHWWLQHKETGKISQQQFAHYSDLILVDDEYRPDTLVRVMNGNGIGYRQALLNERIGPWAILAEGKSWSIFHEDSGMLLVRRSTKREAKQIVKQLVAEVGPFEVSLDKVILPREREAELRAVLQDH